MIEPSRLRNMRILHNSDRDKNGKRLAIDVVDQLWKQTESRQSTRRKEGMERG